MNAGECLILSLEMEVNRRIARISYVFVSLLAMVKTRTGTYSSPSASRDISSRRPPTSPAASTRGEKSTLASEFVAAPVLPARGNVFVEEDTDDDSEASTEELQPPSPSLIARTARTTNTFGSPTTRTRLPHNVEKQLLEDIESEGGIHFFSEGKYQRLCKFLDNKDRSRLYGVRGDPIRKKLRRRINYLRTLQPLDYHAILKTYQIRPAKIEKDKQAILVERFNSTKLKKHVRPTKASLEDNSMLHSDDDSVKPPSVIRSNVALKADPVFSNVEVKPDRVTSNESIYPPEPGLHHVVAHKSSTNTTSCAFESLTDHSHKKHTMSSSKNGKFITNSHVNSFPSLTEIEFICLT